MKPLSLLVVDTTPASPLSTPIPTRSTGSDQQSTATLSLMSLRRREGQSGERAVGEKRLVKGTFPHITPFVSRRPLTRPRQPPDRHTLRPAGPASIRAVIMSASVDTTRTLSQSQRPTAAPRGRRLVHRSAAPLPQVSVGSGGDHRRLPSKSLTPFPSCWAHCPTPAPTPMSRTFSPVTRRGNANNPIYHTPSASVVVWSGLGC